MEHPLLESPFSLMRQINSLLFYIFLFYILFFSCVVLIMFLCLLSAPICQDKFLVGVNLLGNKNNSDSEASPTHEPPT